MTVTVPRMNARGHWYPSESDFMSLLVSINNMAAVRKTPNHIPDQELLSRRISAGYDRLLEVFPDQCTRSGFVCLWGCMALWKYTSARMRSHPYRFVKKGEIPTGRILPVQSRAGRHENPVKKSVSVSAKRCVVALGRGFGWRPGDMVTADRDEFVEWLNLPVRPGAR